MLALRLLILQETLIRVKEGHTITRSLHQVKACHLTRTQLAGPLACQPHKLAAVPPALLVVAAAQVRAKPAKPAHSQDANTANRQQGKAQTSLSPACNM